ncbi:MAG: Flp pilus assembly protein CpaB [Acidobacteriota bacterium]|nr:Flp pilus assembly protein CpaB [Acidobacteriota bacterium]
MKKHMVPLLAIAFIVAIISTGLFYGLFARKLSGGSNNLPKQNVVVAARQLPRGAVLTSSDVELAEIRGSTVFRNSFNKPEQVIGATVLDPFSPNQALTKSSLLLINGSDGSTVPSGMRAITVHVLESAGVISLLHAGSRVDIQAISDRNSVPGETHTVLRTIFQNVEVLSVSPQSEQVGLRFSAAPVTVQVRAEDSDALAVADTGARLRMALRNRLDESNVDRIPVTWPQSAPKRVLQVANAGAVSKPPAGLLLARVVAVNAKGAERFSACFPTGLNRGTLNVARFGSQADAESLVRQLTSEHDLEIVASVHLRFESRRTVVLPGGSGSRLSVSIHAERASGVQADNHAVLRVQPVVSWPEGQGIATRSVTADLPMPLETAFLISGIPEPKTQGNTDKDQVMVIVTPVAQSPLTLAARVPRT